MVRSEKIIRGLECCAYMCESGAEDRCKECPYWGEAGVCSPVRVMTEAAGAMRELEQAIAADGSSAENAPKNKRTRA